MSNSINEIFIGLVSTVGTDKEIVIRKISEILDRYNYKVKVIRVSQNIISQFEKNGSQPEKGEFDRLSHYMDLGNYIRKETKDNAILAKGVASYISQIREKDGESPKPENRTAYIISSIKHPDEVQYLREVYGDGFYLVSVSSDKNSRLKYLIEQKGISKENASELLSRDENEELSQGQHTREAFQHGDYFLCLTDNIKEMYESLSRFIKLIFAEPFITPTFNEYAMFMAFASSIRSADLSRQVGAVVTKNNEILSTGANDCPRANGGLYWPIFKDGMYQDEEDGRDCVRGYDSNKCEQNDLINKILTSLNIEPSSDNINKVKLAGIGDITEYGRVVHAEMEAILCCSRNNISCRGADLYVTTFPCHNCAKHIIAAGIKNVIYIEPYPKSKTFEFYKHETYDGGVSKTETTNKVVFQPFTGVGPQKFLDLFAVSSIRWKRRKRKDANGKRLCWNAEEATPRNQLSYLSYLELEQNAVLQFEDETHALR